MNILRLSTFSLTIILFTVGVLILPVNTALAHCKGPHEDLMDCDVHSHGGGGGDGNTGTTYSVEVETNVPNGVETTSHPSAVGCVGTSTPSHQLSVKFLEENRADCGPVEIEGPVEDDKFFVYLLEIAVQEKRKGDTARFFFTSEASPQFAGNEFVWHSDALPADVDPKNAGVIEITGSGGSWAGFHLTKTHQPDKGSESPTPITVGTIVYTPE